VDGLTDLGAPERVGCGFGVGQDFIGKAGRRNDPRASQFAPLLVRLFHRCQQLLLGLSPKDVTGVLVHGLELGIGKPLMKDA
jgi:hypothetical protein